MAKNETKIEWTHVPGYRGATWNPVTGCSHVSDGCVNCYAEELATGRLKGSPGYPGLPWTKANADVNVIEHPDRLDQPLRQKAPRAYFVNSMSDLFHENVSDRFLDQAFAVMALTPRHLYMILTKRPERMYEYLGPSPVFVDPRAEGRSLPVPLTGSFDLENILSWEDDWEDEDRSRIVPMWPLPNVWLGVSAERQRELDQRLPLLRATPAAVRFVSAEPLLGPLDLDPHLDGDDALDWVIVGGESGLKRRPMDLRWLHDIGRQCRRAGTPLFVKQDSAHRPGQQGRIEDGWWAEKNWPSGASLL